MFSYSATTDILVTLSVDSFVLQTSFWSIPQNSTSEAWRSSAVKAAGLFQLSATRRKFQQMRFYQRSSLRIRFTNSFPTLSPALLESRKYVQMLLRGLKEAPTTQIQDLQHPFQLKTCDHIPHVLQEALIKFPPNHWHSWGLLAGMDLLILLAHQTTKLHVINRCKKFLHAKFSGRPHTSDQAPFWWPSEKPFISSLYFCVVWLCTQYHLVRSCPETNQAQVSCISVFAGGNWKQLTRKTLRAQLQKSKKGLFELCSVVLSS